jgi:hypothetical protein
MANSSPRRGATVLWVTVHTAEGIRKATDLVVFFNRSTNSSCHAVADDKSLIDNLVPYDRAAWTLRDGNSKSDNLELCGFAKWTRGEWLNEHKGMLTNAAIWIHRRCKARGIPIRRIGAGGVRAGRAGVIGHVDYTTGTGDGTHWDPGPGFPWDWVIEKAKSFDKPAKPAAQAVPSIEDSDMQLVKGDKKPHTYVVYWTGPGSTAHRKHIPSTTDAGYVCALALGYKVKTVAQAVIDAIPDGK